MEYVLYTTYFLLVCIEKVYNTVCENDTLNQFFYDESTLNVTLNILYYTKCGLKSSSVVETQKYDYFILLCIVIDFILLKQMKMYIKYIIYLQ